MSKKTKAIFIYYTLGSILITAVYLWSSKGDFEWWNLMDSYSTLVAVGVGTLALSIILAYICFKRVDGKKGASLYKGLCIFVVGCLLLLGCNIVTHNIICP